MVVRHYAILGRFGSGTGDIGYHQCFLWHRGAEGFEEKEGPEFEGIMVHKLTCGSQAEKGEINVY